MKTIILLRHAKSSWERNDLRDHDRPLAPRGRRDAPVVGAWLAREGLSPRLVLCSTATRARETWELLAEGLGGGLPTVRTSQDLYGASQGELLAAIRSAPDDVDRILLVGHNPGMERLALSLAGPPPPENDGEEEDGGLRRMARKYPTCAVAVFRAPVDRWMEVSTDTASFERFVRPKDLAGGSPA